MRPIAYGPSVGRNIALGYLPKAYAEEGRILTMEYFCEHYPVKVEAVGPQNEFITIQDLIVTRETVILDSDRRT